MGERLPKILSQWGIASRRQAEKMLLEGRVRLNGEIVHLGQKADPNLDKIEVDGVAINPASRPQQVYLLLNKPAGFVSTCHDPWHRPTVLDLLPKQLREAQGIHPVGRLDADSTGALLLTNDGELTHGLTHPRYHIAKTYHVRVQGRPSDSNLKQWRQGVRLSGQKTLPAQVKVIKLLPHEQTLLSVVMQEGRNRQIRKIAEQLGYPVIRLHRIGIGPLQLRQLPSRQYRSLNSSEVSDLWNSIDAAASLQ
ncbi:MAG: rRNA pseudouridine synthase [Cyanothece sp. SIO1E1]|nr:rRNA pseudouridine synthase [Cyanothece sp. SIO1E1]